jgi:dihydrofolate reductase
MIESPADSRSDSVPATRPRISLIAAVARNGVIGRKNALPWHLPADLKRFKALTLGHPVVMGRKTWDSILATLGKLLPGRTSIVVSRSPSLPAAAAGAIVSASLPAAIAAAGAADEVFVIGGAEIYALALPEADRLYLTEVDTEPEGDAWFPRFDKSEFVQTTREAGPPEGKLGYDFVTYDRRRTGR